MDAETSGSDVLVVMPAYNAGKTLVATFKSLSPHLQRSVLLVDDASTDNTVQIARSLGIAVIQHERNSGYGANQKTCYRAALATEAQFVIMLHPDNQYDARLCDIMIDIVRFGICDIVLGCRIRTRREALDGGMPLWKYLVNRLSTLFENFVLGQTIGDFHSGFRCYSRTVLEAIPFEHNSDDFAFDQEFLIQAISGSFRVGDIPTPVRYFAESSSISFRRSIKYGLGGLKAIGEMFMAKVKLRRSNRFPAELLNRTDL